MTDYSQIMDGARAEDFHGAGGLKTAADLTLGWAFFAPPPIWLPGFRRALIRAWRDQFGSLCIICDRAMTFNRRHGGRSHYASIDHIVPKSKGGTDDLPNLRVICRRCNMRKGDAA